MRRVVIIAATTGVCSVATVQAQPNETSPPSSTQPEPSPVPAAQPNPDATPAPAAQTAPVQEIHTEFQPPPLQIHGFISEGAFLSTDNDFIGHSSRGSLEFFQAAVNISTELTDKLHAGLQLFSQDEGTANDATPRLDWAFLDYRYKPWLGARVGRVRIPFGLYNDYIDIDASRLQILLPQSIYPITDRNILTAQNGFSGYGMIETKKLGVFDYQAYAGVLSVPLPAAQDANATRIYGYDSRYVAGLHLLWRPPLDGLRVGGSFLRTSLDYYLNLSPSLVESLVMSGAAPANFDGSLTLAIRPANLWIVSAEYVHGDWLFATEYSHWITHTRSMPVNLLPRATSISERLYGLATYRLTPKLDSGVYYSVQYADVNDRSGSNMTEFAKPYLAWSRDAAASLRYDINEHWLVKLESHFIDGAAALSQTLVPMPTRYWGLFLIRTTVTF